VGGLGVVCSTDSLGVEVVDWKPQYNTSDRFCSADVKFVISLVQHGLALVLQ